MLAEIIAKRLPEQLGLQLLPKRKPWMSEQYQVKSVCHAHRIRFRSIGK
jgi:hypothetical protein